MMIHVVGLREGEATPQGITFPFDLRFGVSSPAMSINGQKKVTVFRFFRSMRSVSADTALETNGNLPRTHAEGIGEWTAGEITDFAAIYGGKKLRSILRLPSHAWEIWQGRECLDSFFSEKEAAQMLLHYNAAMNGGCYTRAFALAKHSVLCDSRGCSPLCPRCNRP